MFAGIKEGIELALMLGGVLAIILFVPLMVFGSTIESKYLPVSTPISIFKLSNHEDGRSRYYFVYEKHRQCPPEFNSFKWFSVNDGIQSENSIEAVGSLSGSKPIGINASSVYIVDDRNNKENTEVKFVFNSRCHVLWKSYTELRYQLQ